MNQQQKENNTLPSKGDVIASVKDAKENNSSISIQSRILLVDDETDIVTVYENGLRRDGFEVEAYDDPEMALSHFKPDAYDLAILDIRMPKMSGFELCREIRKRDEKVKICFMTAFEIYMKEFEKVLPSVKIDELITKPVRMADLCSTARRVLSDRVQE